MRSKSGKEKALGFIKLIRPINCAMMGFAVIVGALVAASDDSSLSHVSVFRLLLGFSTAFTLTGASMAINDYWDRNIDEINEPSRPIPSGIISPAESLISTAALTMMGFTTAILTSPLCLIIAALSWATSIFYNTRGKETGLSGNFLVSLCVAVPLIYGNFVVREELMLSAFIFASLAFLSNTGREVTKGIADVEGDKARNIKTIAVSHGERAAAYVATLFYILSSSLSFLPIYLQIVDLFWFLPFVLVADAGFVASSVMLVKRHSRENAKRVKDLVLVWMMFGLLAFIVGSITK